MNLTAFTRRHPVAAYFVLACGISWGCVLMVAGPGSIVGTTELPEAMMPLAIMAMLLGTSLAGLLLTGLVDGRAGFRELLSRLLRWRVGAQWYAVALLTAPVLITVVLSALSLLSSDFIPGIFVSDDKITLLLSGLVAGLIVGIGEELGWTGFAIPRLRLRHSLLSTGLIVGIVWGVWHFPLFSGGGGSFGLLPRALFLAVQLFSFLPAFRVLMVWVYDRTGSLLVAMLMHTSLAASNFIFMPQATPIQFVIYDLGLATALWVFVAAVAAANHGQFARQPLSRQVA